MLTIATTAEYADQDRKIHGKKGYQVELPHPQRTDRHHWTNRQRRLWASVPRQVVGSRSSSQKVHKKKGVQKQACRALYLISAGNQQTAASQYCAVYGHVHR